MLALAVTTWSEGHVPSECGVQIDGTRFSFEDLDEITSREDAEAAGIPTTLLDEYRGNWGLYGMWLEDRAVWGGPMIPEADLQEFSRRLKVRRRLIRSTIAKLTEDNKSRPEPPSEPQPKAQISRKRGAR